MCRYQVDNVGFDARHDRYGLYAQFDQDVEVTVSKLEIGLKTLATRIGGIIGVGKELVWVIILVLSTIGSILSIMRVECRQ